MAQDNQSEQGQAKPKREFTSRDFVAGLMVIGGIAGAPLTGGMSLAMTGAGAVYLGAKSFQSDDGWLNKAWEWTKDKVSQASTSDATPDPNATTPGQTATDTDTDTDTDTLSEEQQQRQQAAAIAEAAAAEARRRAAAQQQAADEQQAALAVAAGVEADAHIADGDGTSPLDPDAQAAAERAAAVEAMRSRAEGPQIEAKGNPEIIDAFQQSIQSAAKGSLESQRKVTDDDKLQFPNEEDAKKFFKQQAEAGKAFEMADPAKDFYVFSNGETDENGDAVFFSGTKADLITFKKSLNAEQSAEAQHDASADQSDVQQPGAATVDTVDTVDEDDLTGMLDDAQEGIQALDDAIATIPDDEEGLDSMSTTTPEGGSPTAGLGGSEEGR